MNKIQIVRNFINKLPKYTEYKFKFVRESLTSKDISVSTIRKYLHRLHDEGLITITGTSLFIKEDKNFEVDLFVYGSLKKGFDNNGILGKATYISKAVTVRKFALYKSDDGAYPYLVKNKSLNNISGELFKIKRKDLMLNIDIFEGSPDFYIKEAITVKTRSGNRRAFTYFYVDTKNHNKKIPISEWKKPEKFDMDSYYKLIMESDNG